MQTWLATYALLVLAPVMFGVWRELIVIRRKLVLIWRLLVNFSQLLLNVLAAQAKERAALEAKVPDQTSTDALQAEATRLGVDDKAPTA